MRADQSVTYISIFSDWEPAPHAKADSPADPMTASDALRSQTLGAASPSDHSPIQLPWPASDATTATALCVP